MKSWALFTHLFSLLLLVACNATTGSKPDDEANTSGTTAGTTAGGGTSGGATNVAGWSFPISTSNVQYAFMGLDYSYKPVTGLGAGPWTVTFSAGAPAWLNGSVNGLGELVLSGTPGESNKSYVPLDVFYTDGGPTRSVRFSLYVRGDRLRPYQWHLSNDGASVFSRDPGVAGEDMDVFPVWKSGNLGSGINIAVSDTGVDTAHEDLVANLLPSKHRNYKTGTSASGYLGTPSPSGEAHGTAVSGIIAAVGWNDKGATGIAPQARVAGFQFLDSNQTTAMYVHQATGDFDVFNYSYGTGANVDIEDDPLFIAQLRSGVTTGRAGKGQIYVKAGGNEYDYFCRTLSGYSGTVCLPQNANIPVENNSPYWMVVGASNAVGVRSSYSNAGSNLWVVAPGGEYGNAAPAILTTDLSTCSQGYSTATAGPYTDNQFETYDSHSSIFTTFNPNCDYTSVMNGSSSATPMVSGVAALMLAANPNLKWRDIKHILAVTAERIDASQGVTGHPESQFDLAGHAYELGWVQNNATPRRYYNNWYGFGRVNAKDAVAMAKDPSYVALPAMLETNRTFDASLGHGETGVNDAIPDGDANGVVKQVAINYGTTVIESVQVKLSITHPRSGSVGVELISPLGTRSILLNINNALLHRSTSSTTPDRDLEVVLTTHAFYGETATGNWQIKIIDGINDAQVGTLTDWTLNILGH